MCAYTIAAYINIVRFLDNPSQHWFQKERWKQTHMMTLNLLLPYKLWSFPYVPRLPYRHSDSSCP